MQLQERFCGCLLGWPWVMQLAQPQPPFFSLLQLRESPFILKENGNGCHILMWLGSCTSMDDLRHFATMSIVSLIIELMVRTYYNITNFNTLYKGNRSPNHKYKLTTMLTMAHLLYNWQQIYEAPCYS